MKSLCLLIIGMMSLSAMGSELKDCEAKISKMIKQIKTQELKVFSNRSDTYHMGHDNLCGVELTEKFLTVTMFKEDNIIKKFETIILNGNDPTFTQGRVQAKVSCHMDENSVVYETRVPVLTDGIKSPYAIEKLVVRQNDQELYVSLRASVTPINGVFKSITDCYLSVEK